MISHEGTKARRHEGFKKETFHASSDAWHRQQASLNSFSFSLISSLSFLRAFVPSCLCVKNGGAWLLTAVCYLLTSGSALRAEDWTTISPKSTYKVSQEAIKDGISRFWTSKLHFSSGKRECVTLSDSICWPGDFYISPDEKWVLQIQKTGSGDNNGFLYLVEPNHRVWKMTDTLCPLAFEFLSLKFKLAQSDLYHTGITFDAWDIPNQLLRFTIHGAKESGGRIEYKLAYELQKHTVVKP